MPTLTSQTLPRADLAPATIADMFAVFRENFEQTSPDIFQRDLAKVAVIVFTLWTVWSAATIIVGIRLA